MPEQRIYSIGHVLFNGSPASEKFMNDVVEIMVESSLHLPDVATIRLFDEPIDGAIHWIDSSDLDPGTALVIKLGQDETANAETVFDGEIVELEPEYTGDGIWLTVRAFDRMHRLNHGRFSRTFVQVTDSDLVAKVAGEVGLSPIASASDVQYDYVIQRNETNMEFLRSRASRAGRFLYVDGRKLHFDEVPASITPRLTLHWNSDLLEFRPRLTGAEQVSEVIVRGWNPKDKQAVVGQVTEAEGAPHIGYSTTATSAPSQFFGHQPKGMIVHQPVRTQDEAQHLAKSYAGLHGSRYIEAEGTCVGAPTLTAGVGVELCELGTRYNGKYFVTNVTHVYNTDGYVTHFTVSGRNPSNLLGLFHENGEREAAVGPVVGIVTNNNDPDGHGRVKVKFPWLGDSVESDWGRVVAPGGGDKRGWQFLPEINDEVLVDFEQGDMHFPYILGGLWNGKDALPKANADVVGQDGKVNQRIIRTRTGHMVVLDDSEDKSSILIQDKSGNKIFLDTQNNNLEIKVANDVQITAGGKVQVDAQQDVIVNTEQNATVKAMKNITAKAQENAEVEALEVKVTANTQATVKAMQVKVTADTALELQGTAEVSIKGAIISIQADGVLQLKGSIVQIN